MCQARFLVRDLRPGDKSGDPAGGDDAESKMNQAEKDCDEAKSQLQRWIKTHYGEAFSAWMQCVLLLYEACTAFPYSKH